MLWALLLLGGLGGPGEALMDDSETLRVQITVPEKLRSVTSEGLETEVSYKIAIEGTTYIVNLTQKTFLPHNFEVYGYDEAGIMKPLDEEVQNFCYYRGYIEGYANSLVIITTCTGLRLSYMIVWIMKYIRLFFVVAPTLTVNHLCLWRP